ncbi:glutamyl aminopeptidase-like [Clytia hemisphaerica]|uniref:Aminopeptidase n=1 Tax=Clytia hemisphaerica TaxID=252671 RepID=A0A7M5V7B3_9CNID
MGCTIKQSIIFTCLTLLVISFFAILNVWSCKGVTGFITLWKRNIFTAVENPNDMIETDFQKTDQSPLLNIQRITQPSNHTGRLPKHLKPLLYDISLDLSQDEPFFTGISSIKFVCLNETNQIMFHGGNFSLVKLDIRNETQNGTLLSYKDISYMENTQMFIVQLNDNLKKNSTYYLHVVYKAEYSTNLAGIQKNIYFDEGVQKEMISIYSKPTYARTVFPCFDEPSFKARFRLHITHQANTTAVSNTPIERSYVLQSDWSKRTTVFTLTPYLCTYLVSFSINNHAFKETTTNNGLKIRLFSKQEEQKKIVKSLKTVVKTLDFLESAFNVSLGLTKLDIVADPNYKMTPMSSYGLLVFRSALLVFDERCTTVEYERTGTIEIAQRIAQLWFGNMVTFDWWNDVWLSESFSNYFGIFAIDSLDDQTFAREGELTKGRLSSMDYDDRRSAHPLIVHEDDIQNTFQIDDLFDLITFNKGVAVVEMMSNFIGQKEFLNGITSFLEENAYNENGVTTKDLWKAFEQVNQIKQGENNSLGIGSLMYSWTHKPNYPIVTLKRVNNSMFKLTQGSIINVELSTKNQSVTNETLWNIPFTYITDQNKTSTLVWLSKKETILNFPYDVTWLKSNVGMVGYYVTNYDDVTWNALIDQLKQNKEVFDAADRATLLNDAFTLANKRSIDPLIALRLSEFIKYEMDYLPIKMFQAKYQSLMDLFDPILMEKYLKFTWKIQSHLVIPEFINDRSNQSEVPHKTRTQRMETFKIALKQNVSGEMYERVKNVFENIYTNQSGIGLSPENRLLALYYGFEAENVDHYNFLWRLFRTSPIDTDRRILMKAFPRFKQLVNSTLANAFNTSIVSVQDTGSTLAQLTAAGSLTSVWQYIKTHYTFFEKRYSNSHDLSKLLIFIMGRFNTEEMLNEAQKFLDSHPLGGVHCTWTEKYIIETIQHNKYYSTNQTKIKTDEKRNIEAWLDSRITNNGLFERKTYTRMTG